MWQMYLLAFLTPALILSVPVIIATWSRWQWTPFDIVVLAIPGALWIYLIAVYGGSGRSLSNLVELPLLAFLTAVLAWLKGPIQRRIPRESWRYLLPVATLLLPIACYLLFPVLDE